jgi:phosphate starvation-inducible protein PhoH
MDSLDEIYNDNKGKGKGGRQRNKKQNQKELLNMYYADYPKEEPDQLSSHIRNDPQYLSVKEKSRLESRFTTPKNERQEYYAKILKNEKKKITVATGPAGTGKTLFAVEYGIRNFLFGKYEKLIFTRPSVSVDEDLGYLPGTLEEKMAPWIRPIYDILYQFISPKEVTQFLEDKYIEIAPLGFMRGRTFKNTWIIADEMQNSTVGQMKMLLTRLGENSRLVITGDLEQHDRPEEANGLDDFLQKFKGKRSASITSLEFERTDIQREDVVREILDIYSGEVIPENYVDIENTSSINNS